MHTQRTSGSLTRRLGVWFIASLVAGAALIAFTHPGSTFVPHPPDTLHAAPETPTYIYSLSPTSATTATFEVKLTISNCMGVAPPSSSWYGPSGPVSQTCSGSPTLIREYIYASGSLFQVIDHFYISPCSRAIGAYYVDVGWDYTGYFSIAAVTPPTSNFYLPMLMTKAWDQAPAAFTKVFPTNGMAALQPLGLILDWENSRGTTAYAYCYDTSNDNACSSWVETGTTSQAILEGLSASTTYYWQVRATNSLGSTYADGAPTAFWSFTTSNVLADTWTEMTAAAEWSARENHTSVALPDGSLVLMGGDDGAKRNDVWRSTNQGATWTEMTAAAAWSARSGHTSVVLPDGSIVLMGGYNGSSREDDVWRSTDQGATWIEMTDDAPWVARNAHTSVALPDGSIVLMAGYTGNSYRNDVWRSTDQGATWTQMTAAAEWSGRTTTTSVALPDGSLVLMGGYTGSIYKNDVWRSTNQGATWTQMTSSAGWAARTSPSSVALPGGSLLLMGGDNLDAPYFNDVWLSTDLGATWTEMIASAEWSARWHHTCGVLPDGSVVLIGGYDGAKRNDVWRLDISGE